MEKNYTVKGLKSKIKYHPYNSFNNGEFSKRLSTKNKTQLYAILKQLDELSQEFINKSKFAKVGFADTPKEEPQTPQTPQEPETPSPTPMQSPKRTKPQEMIDEFFEEDSDDDDPIDVRAEYLKKRKEKIQKNKEERKKQDLMQKAKGSLDKVEDFRILDQTQTKKQSSKEIKHLINTIKRGLNRELKGIPAEIRYYNNNDEVYPFKVKQEEIVNMYCMSVDLLIENIKDIIECTEFSGEEDQKKYKDYINGYIKKFIDSGEESIAKAFK